MGRSARQSFLGTGQPPRTCPREGSGRLRAVRRESAPGRPLSTVHVRIHRWECVPGVVRGISLLISDNGSSYSYSPSWPRGQLLAATTSLSLMWPVVIHSGGTGAQQPAARLCSLTLLLDIDHCPCPWLLDMTPLWECPSCFYGWLLAVQPRFLPPWTVCQAPALGQVWTLCVCGWHEMWQRWWSPCTQRISFRHVDESSRVGSKVDLWTDPHFVIAFWAAERFLSPFP